MTPARELRYYASIPKLLLFLCSDAMFIALGWWATLSVPGESVISWAMLVTFVLFALFILIGCFFMGLLRQPMLQIDDVGITHVSTLTP